MFLEQTMLLDMDKEHMKTRWEIKTSSSQNEMKTQGHSLHGTVWASAVRPPSERAVSASWSDK